MDNGVLLSARGLSKQFSSSGKRMDALKNVSFDIRRGEIFGLVGESGSGKTTVGRIIVGIYEPSDGEVYFHGKKIRAGREGCIKRIKRAKAWGRAEFLRLSRDSARNPDAREDNRNELDNVKNYVQTTIKDERRLLSEARGLGKRRTHPKIQMIFQDPSASLNPRMTVGESVAEGLIASGVKDRNRINDEVDHVLASVGMSARDKGRYPHEFSGGQRQRIGIARAVIMRPELLIADEPVSALDVSVQAQVINLIDDLAKELSLSVLFIAHDLSVVRHISDRIGVMYKGEMVELGNTEEIFSYPCHPYTKALLSAMPLADPLLEKARVRTRYEYIEDGVERSFTDIGDGHFVLADAHEANDYRRGRKEWKENTE